MVYHFHNQYKGTFGIVSSDNNLYFSGLNYYPDGTDNKTSLHIF